jgi:hypothetical protein
MRKCAIVPVLLALFAGCSGSSEVAMDTSEPWDLVWFSDSTGFGLADLWGERIHDELGVDVNVHDFASGGLSAIQVLEWLGDGDDSLPNLKEWLAEAEVVVVYGNPEESGATTDIGTCVDTDATPRPAPIHNSVADWQPYGDALAQIYDIIFDLRGDEPTIVRAMDMYNPVIADWRAAGIEPECTAAWEMMARTVRETAAKYDVPTVSMYDAFNGIDHSEDPRVKGYITYDNQHTNDAGKAAMVEVLDSVGYEPIGA